MDVANISDAHGPAGVKAKSKHNLNLKLVPNAPNFPISNRQNQMIHELFFIK